MLRRKTLNQIHATHRDRIASRPRIAAAIMLCAIPFFGGFLGGAALAADAKHADASHADHDAGHGDHGHLPEIGHNLPAGTTQKAFESPAWFQTDLAVWSFVVFLGLLGLLTKFAWKPIMDGLDKREQGIADTIAATQAANEDAKRMLASYERRLAEATDEVRGMLEEARRDADVTRQAIVAEARKAADDEKNRARHEIGLAKDDALAQIADRAGDLAVEVAGKFLREKLGREDQARLVRDSVASIGMKPSVN
jgi:F-type H+-transporting ATPase subunit b